jgi:hypothetical protein
MVSAVELIDVPWFLHGLLPYDALLAKLLQPGPMGTLSRDTAKLFFESRKDDLGFRDEQFQAQASLKIVVSILANPTIFGAGTAKILAEMLKVFDAGVVAALFDQITPPTRAGAGIKEKLDQILHAAHALDRLHARDEMSEESERKWNPGFIVPTR